MISKGPLGSCVLSTGMGSLARSLSLGSRLELLERLGCNHAPPLPGTSRDEPRSAHCSLLIATREVLPLCASSAQAKDCSSPSL